MSKSHPDIETIIKVFRSYCEVTWNGCTHCMGRYDPRGSRYAVSLLTCHGEYAEARGKMVAGN